MPQSRYVVEPPYLMPHDSYYAFMDHYQIHSSDIQAVNEYSTRVQEAIAGLLHSHACEAVKDGYEGTAYWSARRAAHFGLLVLERHLYRNKFKVIRVPESV